MPPSPVITASASTEQCSKQGFTAGPGPIPTKGTLFKTIPAEREKQNRYISDVRRGICSEAPVFQICDSPFGL
jgi:hypothetical protein